MKKLLTLLVALAATGTATPVAIYAQTAAAGAAAPAQAADPKEAVDAWTAWSKMTDPAGKFQAGLDLIKTYPGTKVAENVAGTAFNDKTLSNDQKATVARTYYDAYTAGGKTGTYLQYSLSFIATTEKDPAKALELGSKFISAYPTADAATLDAVKKRMTAVRFAAFQEAVKANRIADALKYSNDAQAAGETLYEYYYASQLAGFALTDLNTNTTKSQYIAQAPGWADRAIAYLDAGKVPEGVDKAKWDADKQNTLNKLYLLKGYSAFLTAANKAQAATPADVQTAIDLLTKATTYNDKDFFTYLLLGQANNALYVLQNQKYSTFTDQASPDAQAALANVNAAADAVLKADVKMIQIATTDPKLSADAKVQALVAQTQKTVSDLWAYRYPAAPEGWKEAVKTGVVPPPPAATTTTTSTTTTTTTTNTAKTGATTPKGHR